MPAFKRKMFEEICRRLEHSGLYVTEMAVDPAQRVVDVWWAAHAAARQLGKRVQISTEARHHATGQRVVITVRARPSSVQD